MRHTIRTTIELLAIALAIAASLLFAPDLASPASAAPAAAAVPPADPGPAPYTTRSVRAHVVSWVRWFGEAETILGAWCERRNGRVYYCFVDTIAGDQAMSHGFFECRRRATIKRNGFREYPETAYVYMGRAARYPGGIVCQHDYERLSLYRKAHKSPYRGTGTGR